MRSVFRFLAVFALALFAAAPASATLIEVVLGEQDFNDGDIVFPLTFNGASGGEPAPFDAFRGSDPNTDFSESWTFNYAPIVDPFEVIVSVSIEIGILDHDSAHPGSQVLSFEVDGIDLTASLQPVFEASGGANNEYNVYVLSIPAATFSALLDGSATFTLVLQGPTPGLLDDLPNNGAGLDFARLVIETTVETPSPVSEPSPALLFLAAAIGWIARRRPS